MPVLVRPLRESDLAEADRIFRLAFGTFLGLPDPATFGGDAEFVGTRWRADPTGAFGAFEDARLIGSNFATPWGTFGFFGPLTVDPAWWGKGVAKRLLEPTMARFDQWQTGRVGLFTFPQSAKHIGLYQSFGFWPQRLTAVMTAPIATLRAAESALCYSSVAADERTASRDECRILTSAISEGLDPAREIDSVLQQSLGDTVLLREQGRLDGFAVCHIGARSEAGSGTAYVKVGAVRPGDGAAGRFERLLAACARLAADRGAAKIRAGVNTARTEAYRAMLARGFRAVSFGIAMQRPDVPGHNRPECYILDDWL